MRLLDTHSRDILIANLLILLLGGVLFYLLLNGIMDRNIDDTLNDRRNLVRNQLALSDSIYIYQRFSGHIFSITRLNEPHPVRKRISDTVIYDQLEEDQTRFRQLTFAETIRNQPYLITVRRPLIDEGEILRAILVLVVLMSISMIVALYFANRLVSIKLWQPFYTVLARLRNYHIGEKTDVELPQTDVTEFQELNQVLNGLIERVRADYYALKEYSENTTHEIQTPLAIIAGKLELLQESDLTNEQLQLVNAASQAVRRLSRLKEALLLLVRIRNGQYVTTQPVSLAALLTDRLSYFQELVDLKEMRLTKQLAHEGTVHVNPVLAEILIDNLLSNAIKHNVPGGTISVNLSAGQLVVKNTGHPPRVPTDRFFDRFVKSDPHSRSLGLGLAIVKAICDTNGLAVTYTYEDDCHRITISFATTDSLQNQFVLENKS